MSLHELLEQGPSVYVPVILISLLITLLAYGAFPMIYSRARSQAISSKKFTLHCYGFNFLVLAIFICINGASSGGPYVLWTGVFSAAGIKVLKDRGVLEGANTNIKTVDDKVDDHLEVNTYLSGNGYNSTGTATENDELSDSTAPGPEMEATYISQAPRTKAKERHCKKCGAVVDRKTKRCTGCGKQYPRAKVVIPITIIIVLLIASLALNTLLYLGAVGAIKQLDDEIAGLNEGIKSLEIKAEYYDEICKELSTGNIGYASDNFCASEDVIVLSKYETGRSFTLTAHWSAGGTVETTYSGSSALVSFDEDSWYSSTGITITPMRKGITAVTFSNSVDSNTFKVLIIVTD